MKPKKTKSKENKATISFPTSFKSNEELFNSAQQFWGTKALKADEAKGNRVAELSDAEIKSFLSSFQNTLACKGKAALSFVKIVRELKLSLDESLIFLYMIRAAVFGEKNQSASDVAKALAKFTQTSYLSLYATIVNNSGKLRGNELLWLSGRDEIRVDAQVLQRIICTSSTGRRQDKKPKQLKIKYTPYELYTELNKAVIGQSRAKQTIAAGIIEHLTKVNLRISNNKKYGKSNILLLGPSGSGKTYICEVISKILNMPVFVFDATTYSKTGYAGDCVSGMIGHIAKQTKTKNNGIIPPCIAVIDEIDKIAMHTTNQVDITGKAVQEELLRILESDTISSKRTGLFEQHLEEYHIQNVLFIAAGAFSGIEKIANTAEETNSKIGFTHARALAGTSGKRETYSASTIIDYGFMPEFVGRFAHITNTDKLNKQNLIDILTRSQNNILQQSEEVLSHWDIDLKTRDEIIERLATDAIANGTGARGLAQAFSATITDVFFEKAMHSNTEILPA